MLTNVQKIAGLERENVLANENNAPASFLWERQRERTGGRRYKESHLHLKRQNSKEG